MAMAAVKKNILWRKSPKSALFLSSFEALVVFGNLAAYVIHGEQAQVRN